MPKFKHLSILAENNPKLAFVVLHKIQLYSITFSAGNCLDLISNMDCERRHFFFLC